MELKTLCLNITHVMVHLKRWRERMTYSKKTIIIKIIELIFLLTVLSTFLFSCSNADNNRPANDSNTNVEEAGNVNNKNDESEYVEVSVSSSNFYKYFSLNGTYNVTSTLLYNEYYPNTQIIMQSVYNFFLTYNFTISLKDDSVKVKSPIRSIMMRTQKGLGWSGGWESCYISDAGYASGVITANARGSTQPNASWAFALDLSMTYGTLLVPKDKVV